ncbi:Eukaryotic cobalamin-binding domain-containing protein [Homarus americanus]|uniref:Eukaryotic cobalamin-binding domain-containing protein n=2 Tax=Homarus americanus TaxID=6706 RepID=A0A8J5N7Z0_HOMAM|nr:Eukaryotic cobalamin-binding domain-containing protein [Homarus americanus]
MDERPVLVLPAAARAVEWVVGQRRADWGWGSDTAHTLLALRLANATWFAPENLDAQLSTKQLELELVLRLWKHRELPLTTGHLAVNVMALVALCRDPRAFYSKDLVAMLGHQEGGVDFEVAFAQLATCTAGHHVRKSRIRRLVEMSTERNKIHSIDTLSVVILALHCAQHQRRHDLKHFIDQAVHTLLHHQAADGSFNKNLHSTALALQAMLSSQLAGSWNATRAQEYVMSHQRPDGSFGSLFDTNAVLPLMGGRTLLDVALRRCPRVTHDTIDSEDAPVDEFDMPGDSVPVPSDLTPRPDLSNTTAEELIKTTYIIWKGNNASTHYNLTFNVPVNTTFLTIMKMAAEQDERFVFSASHWGNGLYIHTLAGAKEQKLGYWFWLLYRLREAPVPGVKPDNKFVVGTGVQETIINDGDLLLFWYHQI